MDTITLTVETQNLYNVKKDPPSRKNYEKNCKLKDNNHGCTPGGSIFNFQSMVYLDKNVKWNSRGYEHNGVIVSIKDSDSTPKEDTVDFFTRNPIKGEKGTAKGKVKNDRKLISRMDGYTIHFNISYESKEIKSFSIDPKLQGNP